MKKTMNVLLLITMLFVSSLLVSCVKERPDITDPNLKPEEVKLIKGMGSLQNLGESKSDLIKGVEASNFRGHNNFSGHYIVTSNETTAQAFTNAISVTIEDEQVEYTHTAADGSTEQRFIKMPELVGFSKSNSPLLNQIFTEAKLLAKPNTAYQVVYKASPTMVKVYRVVPEDELSAHISSSLIKDNGKNLSLMGGFPVKYYVFDYSKDGEGRNTNVKKYIRLSEDNYKNAQYYKLDLEGFKFYERQSKVDYFPADFFTKGQWYYAATIVSTKPGLEDKIGDVSGTQDSSLKIATKIKFVQDRGNLRGVNVVTDPRLNLEDEKKDDVINIPVAWTAYRPKQIGTDENSLIETNDELVDELKREFGLFNFKDAVLGTGSAAATIFGRYRKKQQAYEQINNQKDLDKMLTSFGVSEGLVSIGAYLKHANKKVQSRIEQFPFLEEYNLGNHNSHVAHGGSHSLYGHADCLGSHTHSILDQSGSAAGQLNAFFNNHQLKDIKVKENSFSFSILEKSTGTVVKYSFERAKENNNFEEQVAFESDQAAYGFFTTQKFKFPDYQDRTKRDNEKNTLRTTLNKKDKVVKFRFSSITPKIEDLKNDPHRLNIDYREIGYRVVRYWNRAFELAETGMKFEILDGDAEVGDLDVHVINIVDSITSSGLYGVGPTISDPETGEVISGTVNLYTRPPINAMASKLRNHIRFETGQVKEIGIPDELKTVAPTFYTKLMVDKRCPEVVQLINDYNAGKLSEDLFLTSTYENKVINSCMEKTLAKELSATLAHEMGHTPIQLYHNFMGEADADNGFTVAEDVLNKFAKLEQIYPKAQFPEIYEEYYPDARLLPQANSIMEYPSFVVNFPRLAMPGTYDIAAAAFAYGDKVFEKKAPGQAIGKLVAINHETSLKEQNPDNKMGLEEYKYCDDFSDIVKLIGPMCSKTVYGKDPNQLMDAYFHEYRYSLLFNNKKLDRGNFSPEFSAERRVQTIGAMADIYLQWRKELRSVFGDNRQYLDNVDPEQLTNEKIKELAAGNETLLSYIGVNDKFLTYMKAISNIPNYYCVLIDDNNKVDVIEFVKLQSEISKNGNETVNGCLDEDLKEFVSNKYEGSKTIVSEMGYPLQDVKFSVSNDDKTQSSDIGGIAAEKVEAIANLYGRMDSVPNVAKYNHVQYLIQTRGQLNVLAMRAAILANEKPIYPALADEKRSFYDLKKMAEENILSGVDLTTPVKRSIKLAWAEDIVNGDLADMNELDSKVAALEIPIFERYESEWGLNLFKIISLQNSLNIPGKGEREVSEHYRLGLTTDRNYVQRLASNGTVSEVFYAPDRMIFAAFPESLFVKQAIAKANKVLSPLGIVDPKELVQRSKDSMLAYQALDKIRSIVSSTLPVKNDSLNIIKYTDAKDLVLSLSRGSVNDINEQGQELRDQETGQPRRLTPLINEVQKSPKLWEFVMTANSIATIEQEVLDGINNGEQFITSRIGDQKIDVAKYEKYFQQATLDNDFTRLANNIFSNAPQVNSVDLMKEVTNILMVNSPEYVAEWNRRIDNRLSGIDSQTEYDKNERDFLPIGIDRLLRSLGPIQLR